MLAKKGDGDTTVRFYGHLDTVSGTWARDQHDLWIDDGHLYGPGACDMKSRNLAIVRATGDIPEGVTVEVTFGVDREYHSKGSTRLMDYGPIGGSEHVKTSGWMSGASRS